MHSTEDINPQRLLTFHHMMSLSILLLISCTHHQPANTPAPDAQLLSLSEMLLLYVRLEESTDSLEHVMAEMDFDKLVYGLSNDAARNTFWINMYNAWYQILATGEEVDKNSIFSARRIVIAGEKFSLDDIEHGILRRYRWKYGLGYLPKPFTRKSIKTLSVSQTDYRIHFALNCGAKSCPPISFYRYEDIDEDLDMAARSFLSAETDIDEATQSVSTSKNLQWFKGDFGGKRGIREVLSKYLERDLTGYQIYFNEYDWQEDLRNFRDEDPSTMH